MNPIGRTQPRRLPAPLGGEMRGFLLGRRAVAALGGALMIAACLGGARMLMAWSAASDPALDAASLAAIARLASETPAPGDLAPEVCMSLIGHEGRDPAACLRSATVTPERIALLGEPEGPMYLLPVDGVPALIAPRVLRELTERPPASEDPAREHSERMRAAVERDGIGIGYTLVRWYGDQAAARTLLAGWGGLLTAAAWLAGGLGLGIGILAGVSIIGGEYSRRTWVSVLLQEPRRARVLDLKLAAAGTGMVAAGAAIVCLGGLLWWSGSLAPLAEGRSPAAPPGAASVAPSGPGAEGAPGPGAAPPGPGVEGPPAEVPPASLRTLGLPGPWLVAAAPLAVMVFGLALGTLASVAARSALGGLLASAGVFAADSLVATLAAGRPGALRFTLTHLIWSAGGSFGGVPSGLDPRFLEAHATAVVRDGIPLIRLWPSFAPGDPPTPAGDPAALAVVILGCLAFAAILAARRIFRRQEVG